MNKILRPEHPNPQFKRQDWINLNGTWTYTFDFGKSGMERGFQYSKGFDKQIIVPFCPESELSGVHHTDFIEMMWYHRQITVPTDWKDKQIILHFGAVDFESEVFIDGQSVGRHRGGTVAFNHDITRYIEHGKTHNLVVYVRDEMRTGEQPVGKQCHQFKSHGCHYTHTTGIWQTVWMEAVPAFGLKDVQIIPDLDGEQFIVNPQFYAVQRGLRFRVTVKDGDALISQADSPANNSIPCVLPINSPRKWSPEDPFLYDILLEIVDDKDRVLDTVQSYMGLRKVHIEGNQIYINNEPIYLRLVLDQGFYPDGIWTAPDDEALKRDIEISMEAGFNGARLHQKVFEPRFHYWADKLGYLTWGESASWGVDCKSEVSARHFLSEWREILIRDRNHPSIIAWTPLNETHDTGNGRAHNRLHVDSYDLAHALDPTRPVNDASGYVHVKTDIWTIHTYEQNPEKLETLLSPSETTGVYRNFPDKEIDYTGQPYIVDEFGGIKWIPTDDLQHADNSWGYGEGPKSIEEFYERLEGLVASILSHDHITGYCYTQLTDVEQEQNGIYNYDRSEKFDMERIANIFKKSKHLDNQP